MAGDVGWQSVDLQIDALVPGILILVEANALTVRWFDHALTVFLSIPESELVRGALLVAAAYSVGLVSSYISRAMLDSISERGPRMAVFGHFAHHDLSRAVQDCVVNDASFRKDYRREKRWRESKWWFEKADRSVVRCVSMRKLKSRLSIASRIAARWNAVYRSALRRTTRRKEVDRRRSQGRLLRNLLLPAVGSFFIFFPFARFETSWFGRTAGISIFVITCILNFVVIACLYSYAEYVNFAEAFDISEVKRK